MAEQTLTPVHKQVEIALDGRTQRWLSVNAKIYESELSRKMNGNLEFTDEEIERINEALKSNIKK